MNKAFATPQLQSKVGILFIFLSTVYRVFRGLWAVAIYFLFKGFTAEMLLKLGGGLLLLGLGMLAFSYISYLRFKFYVDYDNSEFVLQKGVFSSENINIPFNKIQQVYFKRSLLQRLIGVYSVVIDTAGSSDQEIRIKALSEEKAKALQEILMQEAETREPIADFAPDPESATKAEQVKWTHRLTIPTLIKLGLTTNYFRGVWLILIFAGSLYQQTGDLIPEDVYSEEVSAYLGQYSKPAEILSITALVFVVVFIVGLLITCVDIFVRYFDLKLVQTRESLDLEMGLRTNTRISLKPRRVQLMRFITNPVQRRFDLYEAQIAVASSKNDLKSSKIKIPGLKKEHLEKVKSFLFSQEITEGTVYKPEIYLFYRLVLLAAIPLLFTGLIAWILLPDYRLLLVSLLVIIYGVAVIPYQWFSYKAQSLEMSEDFIVKRGGVWSQKMEVVAIYKIQSVTVKQPRWYKKKDLFNYVFHTAGGDISFPLVSGNLIDKINYCLYRVETSSKPWM